MSDGAISTAIVGYGYWGPNIARNVAECPELELTAICERDPARAGEASRRFPDCRVEADLDAVLSDPDVRAVSIATAPSTHYELARRALLAGKHVLVEKPLATRSSHARELIRIASERGLVLMPGHTFVYSPAVNKVRELISSGELGEVYFVTSSRMNLGLYQADGVISDLAPHDLSILMYWLDQPLTRIAAAGQSVFQHGVPETAFLTLGFAGGATANVQISWLAPRKVRQMVVVGSKRMVLYEDTSSDEAVRVYDRGLEMAFGHTPATFGEYQLTYRSGDVVVPRIDAAEPLALELADFARAIGAGTKPRSSCELGLEIVRALEAAHRSMAQAGRPIRLDTGTSSSSASELTTPAAPAPAAAAAATYGREHITTSTRELAASERV